MRIGSTCCVLLVLARAMAAPVVARNTEIREHVTFQLCSEGSAARRWGSISDKQPLIDDGRERMDQTQEVGTGLAETGHRIHFFNNVHVVAQNSDVNQVISMERAHLVRPQVRASRTDSLQLSDAVRD
ncbi:MAG: hypothetical protein GY772_29680 [bacterium]|nr:hypothetical protein [bacterium]